MTIVSREMREVVREEPAVHRRIQELLAGGPLTVPEIATALGHPAREVLVWVMGMRRYGFLREVPGATADGYFRYQVVEREGRT